MVEMTNNLLGDGDIIMSNGYILEAHTFLHKVIVVSGQMMIR